jgi:hypothetical protein
MSGDMEQEQQQMSYTTIFYHKTCKPSYNTSYFFLTGREME